MKAQIFWQAHEVRSENWLELKDKPKMERTIPIFRALIASDTERAYHANHGQLGYALKDQRDPNWAEAEAELTEAIRLRGNWQASGWLPHYEFVRAICRVNRDQAYKNGKQSDAETTQAIISDLRVAFEHPEIKGLARRESNIREWMELNEVKTIRAGAADD